MTLLSSGGHQLPDSEHGVGRGHGAGQASRLHALQHDRHRRGLVQAGQEVRPDVREAGVRALVREGVARGGGVRRGEERHVRPGAGLRRGQQERRRLRSGRRVAGSAVPTCLLREN